MPARNLRQAALLITRSKLAASRSLPALLGGFGAFLGLLWVRDSFALSLRGLIFLFPYLFLFLSQDMFRDEIDSGALENVIFVNGGFREYLLCKPLILGSVGLAMSAGIFGAFAACGMALESGHLGAGQVGQFLIGTLAGFYYLAVGGYLSFFFRGGSNVLIVIIGQVLLAIGFFLSTTARGGWVESVLSGDFSGIVRKLRFLGLALLFPNAVIIMKRPVFVAGVALAGLGMFGLAWRRIRKLELSRR